MIVYVDAENKCHLSDDGNRTAVETDFFNGKCKAFVEGFLLIVDSSGGIMITPWKDYNILVAQQKQYEAMLTEAAAAYESGVNSI